MAIVAKAVLDPAKGDLISWSEYRNGRRRTYTGKVVTVHADRWLVKVGPGRLHDLRRPAWEATGVIVESAVKPQLVLVTA